MNNKMQTSIAQQHVLNSVGVLLTEFKNHSTTVDKYSGVTQIFTDFLKILTYNLYYLLRVMSVTCDVWLWHYIKVKVRTEHHLMPMIV